jgi:cytochrome c oxidase subunit III
MTELAVARPDAPPGARPSGWWGMVLLIATESTLFALLLATYFYLRFTAVGSWPPDGIADPKLLEPLLATLVVVVAALPFAWASAAAGRLRPGAARLGLAAGIGIGLGFLVFQYVLVDESLDRFRPETNAYGSIFYTLVGLHFVHVAGGILLAIWALARTWRFDRTAVVTVRVTALYWYFLAVVAAVVFLTLYLSPRGG